MLNQSFSQKGELKQEQQMSAHQLHSLELLQASIPELHFQLQKELCLNPVLEIEPSDLVVNIGDPFAQEEAFEHDHEPEEGEFDRLAEWREESAIGQSNIAANQSKRDFFLNSISREASIHEQLLEELSYSAIDARTRELAEMIVNSIDESGYLRTHIADIAMVANADLEEVEKALKVVQAFDPPGIGAFDLKESLRLQLERKGETDHRLYDIIDNYLEEIAQNRLPQVARSIGISVDELNLLLAKIRKLNPYPGAALSVSRASFVVPEVVIEKAEDKYVVKPSDRILRLRIPEKYLKLAEDESLNKEDRVYIKEKISEARELLRSLAMRGSTIRRIAGVIADYQHDFFEYGVEKMKPMTMKEVAEILDLHETTISRAITNKYLDSPRGMFPFKYFFSTGFETDSGRLVSSRSIHELIKQIVSDEDPEKPLSDAKISQRLKEEGFPVARRTVAKYREELNIPATNLRHRHT